MALSLHMFAAQMKMMRPWMTLLLLFSNLAFAEVDVRLGCTSVGVEFELCQSAAIEWSKKTGNRVTLVSIPPQSTDILSLYQQLFSNESPDLDAFKVDVTWAGMLGNHLVDLNEQVNAQERAKHFPAFVETNTVNGKLKAIPWFLDTGLLFYRKDLLEKYGQKVPETWEELGKVAKVVQDGERAKGNSRFWGYVFQARAYEGLTCNGIEWLASSDAGTIVDDKGNVTINNPKAIEMLSLVRSWMGKVVPEGVLNYSEEESRGVFQSGNAAFLRNWPYAWMLANAGESTIKGKVGVAALPHGENGKSVATLGGWALAVSKYSKHKEAAISLAKYMTSEAEQKRRLLKGGFNPSIQSLYLDKDVMAANPFLEKLYPVFAEAVARPSKSTRAKYPRVSGEFWNALHKTLSGEKSAAKNVAELETKLKELSAEGKW